MREWLKGELGGLTEGMITEAMPLGKKGAVAGGTTGGKEGDEIGFVSDIPAALQPSAGDGFRGVQGFSTVLGAAAGAVELQQDLAVRYMDYREMGEYPMISAALDIHADDASKLNQATNKVIWVESPSEIIAEELNDLLDRLKIADDAWSSIRRICHYGNDFAELRLSKDHGVIGFQGLPTVDMRRVETFTGRLVGYGQFRGGFDLNAYIRAVQERRAAVMRQSGEMDIYSTFGASMGGDLGKQIPKDAIESIRYQNQHQSVTVIPFEPWEVVHWRLRELQNTTYGHSVLHDARWAFKRLTLLEDSALAYKLTRSPARFIFYVDVEDKSPKAATQRLHEVKQSFNRRRFVGPDGKIDFRASPLAQDENFFIPTRGSKRATEIELLSGADWQNTDDLEYFRSLLITKLKVPRAYLGLEEGDARSAVAQMDVRFASTVERIQKAYRVGVRQICETHLTLKGIDHTSVKWDVVMTPPSTINQLAQMEARLTQAQLAQQIEPYLPYVELLTSILGYSPEEAARLDKARTAEQRAKAEMEADLQLQAAKKQMELEQKMTAEGVSFRPWNVTPLQEATTKGVMREMVKSGDLERLFKALRDENASAIRDLQKEIRTLTKEVRRQTILSGRGGTTRSGTKGA